MIALPPVGALGAEWQMPGVGSIGGVGGIDPTAPAGGATALSGPAGAGPSGGFGDVLTQQIQNLSDMQQTAATASQSLADGTATDVSSVVTAVEKAQLAMQLAGQIRTKGSEAVNDIFHTQI